MERNASEMMAGKNILLAISLPCPDWMLDFYLSMVQTLRASQWEVEVYLMLKGRERAGMKQAFDAFNQQIPGRVYQRLSRYESLYLYFAPIVRWGLIPSRCLKVYTSLRQAGLSSAEAVAQLMLNGALAGRRFDQIFVTSLEGMEKTRWQSVFPDAEIIIGLYEVDGDLMHPNNVPTLRQGHRFVVPSPYSRDKLYRVVPVTTPAIVLPPVIHDVQRYVFRRFGEVENEPIRICSIGQIDWSADYVLCIRAIRKLIDRFPEVDIQYAIYGEGRYKDAVEVEIDRLDLNACVQVLPTPHTPDQLLQGATIFLKTPIKEGVDQTVFMAQAFGVPCVVTRSDSAVFIQHGVTGYIVEPYDTDGVVEALAKVVAEPVLRRKMGEQAAIQIEQYYAPAVQRNTIVGLFEGVRLLV